MARTADRDFRFVHAMGGRGIATEYFVSLGLGSREEIIRRMHKWTVDGGLSKRAYEAMLTDRGTVHSDDFDVLTANEYRDSLVESAA